MDSDFYAVLGVERGCDGKEIRGAFRKLVKRWHPDVCGDADEAADRTRVLNEAYETLIDPARRRAYDAELGFDEPTVRMPTGRATSDLKQDVFLSPEELIRGTSLDVRVDDPANRSGAESYRLEVPEGTAPGERFRITREEPFAGGVVAVRVKARPGGRFRTKGSDLRMDLRVSAERARSGGWRFRRGSFGTRRFAWWARDCQKRVEVGVTSSSACNTEWMFGSRAGERELARWARDPFR
jgi:curved DNA-binding protein CbpA